VWIVSVALVKLPLADMTSAELAVAELVIAGRSNREIAATRATSPRTVANQLRAIYQKLGVSSRTELLASLSGGS
jgi:DNA-binding NarL/FixJ family response regulator